MAVICSGIDTGPLDGLSVGDNRSKHPCITRQASRPSVIAANNVRLCGANASAAIPAGFNSESSAKARALLARSPDCPVFGASIRTTFLSAENASIERFRQRQ
jgi:hypothetical protein